MWIEETKNGKYKFIERYTDPVTGKYRRVSIVLDKNTKQSQKQAFLALSEKIKDACNAPVFRKDITLSDLLELYRSDQLRTVKLSTYSRNHCAGESFKRIFGPDALVSNFNAGYIRDCLLSTGRDAGTLNEWLKRFKALLRWGYRNDYIGNISYLDKIEKFKDIPHRAKIEDKFLESSEVQDLINGMTVKKWKVLTEFLVLSGLRFGEAAALLLSDVDLKERIIHVTKTYDSANDVVTTTKTYSSSRDVYMQDELYNLCRHIKAERISDSIVVPISNAFFPGSKRDHIEYDCYSKYLRENSERIIGRRITPHTLRHTHASLLMEQGIDIDSISRRLGHANSQITKDIYLHVTKKLKDRENEKIKSIKIL